MAAVRIVVVVLLLLYAGVQCDISVTTTVNPVGLVGKNELELVCTYSLASTDIVFTIGWNRETAKDSGTFEQLAMFFPPGPTQSPASLTNLTNPDVFGRITLTNPTESSLTAKLKFTRVVCGDERKYQCSVLGLSNNIQANPSSETSLTITAMPNVTTFREVEVVPATNIVEGQTVQFACTSNVGLPAGTFLWTKYSGVSDSVGSTVSSTTQTSPSTDCTYTGSSTINIAMTKDDDGVILRCTLQQDTISDPSNNMYYKQTDPIEVYYETRQPTITRNPMKDIYYEDENLLLTCAAEGNPAPTYIWKLNGTQVGTATQLSLSNIQIDQSGDYSCEAKNNFNGNTYNLSHMISITIERPPPTTTVATTSVPQKADISTTRTASTGLNIEEATRMYTAGLVMVCVSLILMLVTIGLGIFIGRNKRLPCCPFHSTESKQKQPVRYLPGYRSETPTERPQYQQLDINSVAGPSVYQTLGLTSDVTDRDYHVLSGRSEPNVYQELSDVNAGKSRHYIYYGLSKDRHNRKLK
ncbi:cell adhesion molecule 1-like isoform X1 [Argopecten irradians]|uniref:cell adhesion molecule 1-like isoform X1 n=1 Tax=Argopecten irradians TaxID=31199 RepID=UPI00371396DF